MVAITVRPIMRYSPLSILCEKRPELSLPTSVTPFWLATLLALTSSKEGLATVTMLNVLAMPPSPRLDRHGCSSIALEQVGTPHVEFQCWATFGIG
jgi:hypothetical protein